MKNQTKTKQPALTRVQIARLNKEATLLAELIWESSITDQLLSDISDYVWGLAIKALESKRLLEKLQRKMERLREMPADGNPEHSLTSKKMILAGYRHWFAAVHY